MDYEEKGKVKVSMVEYIDKVLRYFPEGISRMALMAAMDFLFQVRE